MAVSSRIGLAGALLLSLASTAAALESPAGSFKAIDLDLFRDGASHWQKRFGRDRDDPQYAPDQIVEIAENILRYQNPDGGWPKDLDYQAVVDYEEVRRLRGNSLDRSTFDNDNTYSQIAYLAQVYVQTEEPRFREAAERGLEYVFQEQRPSGGWRGWDVDAITFNDNVMTGVMRLLLDIREGAAHFDWLDDARREQAAAALKRGIEVTLASQIEVGGKKTAWCQQHDHETLAPVQARSYEFPSITSAESVTVVRFLMDLPGDDPRIAEAIEAAVAWFREAAIEGIRIVSVPIEPERFEHHTATHDRVVQADPDAPPIWARFYEIETNRPFFANRDGTKVYSLAEVALERRTGYGWYTLAPGHLLGTHYPAWLARQTESKTETGN